MGTELFCRNMVQEVSACGPWWEEAGGRKPVATVYSYQDIMGKVSPHVGIKLMSIKAKL